MVTDRVMDRYSGAEIAEDIPADRELSVPERVGRFITARSELERLGRVRIDERLSVEVHGGEADFKEAIGVFTDSMLYEASHLIRGDLERSARRGEISDKEMLEILDFQKQREIDEKAYGLRREEEATKDEARSRVMKNQSEIDSDHLTSLRQDERHASSSPEKHRIQRDRGRDTDIDDDF